jgi:hypothetical protein
MRAQLLPFTEQDFIGLATEGLCLNAGATAQGMEIFMVSHSTILSLYVSELYILQHMCSTWLYQTCF